ncbi:hypothetical protein [Sporosarcina sp. FSL K6-3457]|uniref:hypothetical protein n=1 Tax=Sporosarcina sp. FSL K6-3457 TaxID=2978204 RepID=UPI0030F6B0C1
MFLYHMFIENDSDPSISPQWVLKEGLNHKTATKWYSNSGNYFPELTERFRPANLPKWIDFKVAFGADLKPYEEPHFQFPIFSDKIMVFNRDTGSNLFAHYEDKLVGGRGYFVEGLPSKEDLMKQYWESVHTLDEFLKNKPFNNPEIYIFEAVPAMLIEYIE